MPLPGAVVPYEVAAKRVLDGLMSGHFIESSSARNSL